VQRGAEIGLPNAGAERKGRKGFAKDAKGIQKKIF
jgi:hypothetical protein